MIIKDTIQCIKEYDDYHCLCDALSLEELRELVSEYEKLKGDYEELTERVEVIQEVVGFKL